MLIDDDEADNYYHKMIIEEAGITENVLVAENGIDALEMLKKQDSAQPNIIFLDINMPKMNGWEFLDAYNKLDVDNKTKIIVAMLTTSENPADKEKAANAYKELLCGYYTKPLTPAILEEVTNKFQPVA
jgi:CheY-like chemotaxis protein